MLISEIDLKNIVINVSNSPDGLDFIYYLIDRFGTFSSKVSLGKSEFENLARTIRKEQGEFILDLLREYNFEKYVELQQRRSNEKCQKTMN